MSPITLGIDITQEKSLLLTSMNTGYGSGNLTSYECSSTTRRLVVEENSVGKVHTICLTVVHQNPESILLGNGIWRTGVKWSGLGLGYLLDLSVKLGSGGLVEFDLFLHTTSSDGIKHTKNSSSITIGGVFRHIEGNLYVTHGSKIVDLSGTGIGNDSDEVSGITQISIVKEKLNSGFVPVLVDVVDTSGVERGRTTDDTVNGVSLLKKQLGQV
mmetsp:Transcript_8175/g.9528  ORF Transcript_8175/g.9528 Transcript_8175/m.9528 type:complete len:214 (+) Transcript_8175:510-1151(+)